LSRSAELEVNIQDSFLLQPAYGRLTFASVNSPGKCLESNLFSVDLGPDRSQLKVPLLAASACNDKIIRQRFSAVDIPEFLANRYVVTFVKTLDKVSEPVKIENFQDLAFELDCVKLAVGKLEWFCTAAKFLWDQHADLPRQ